MKRKKKSNEEFGKLIKRINSKSTASKVFRIRRIKNKQVTRFLIKLWGEHSYNNWFRPKPKVRTFREPKLKTQLGWRHIFHGHHPEWLVTETWYTLITKYRKEFQGWINLQKGL